ncbi:MAG: isopenicillin N synthase family oxygenase [Alphaproteobacteria bacterium]|nr:isopenicillin N synthase family oxygenase [Alphaproteobacteria bacterium]
MASDAIPVIDLGPYWSGAAGAKQRVADDVAWACENIGFLVISNHGVPQDLIDRAFSVSRDFFDLPAEDKSRFKPADGVAPRGYHALETLNLARTLGQVTPPDLREQFYVGPLAPRTGRGSDVPGAAVFYSENIWPEHPVAYREVFSEFYGVMEDLAARLMRIFATALALPETYFDDKIDHHFSTSPSNHYPVVANDPLPGQIRCGAHTDFGSLTILAFNDAPGGLQVLMPDGSWLAMGAGPGQLVVNLGDMMQRWTNDRWKSTVHRVVNPPIDRRRESRRQTIGYFLHPNYDAEIACLETCTGPDNPPKYPPIMAGEHMREKMERRVDG